MMNYYTLSSFRKTSKLRKGIENLADPRPDSISRGARPSWVSLFLIVMLMAMNHSVWAQSSANYTFATSTTGSLALDMNGGAIDMSTGTTQLVGPGADNSASGVVNIGFDFFLMGNRFTQFSVQDDGILQLGSTVVTRNTYTISGGTTTLPLLSAFNGDLRTGSSTGKIHYKVTGTAPNRVLVVEFFNMQLFYTSTAMTGNATWQMRLYEKGNIEYAYGNVSAVDVGNTAANRSPSVGFFTGSALGGFTSILYATNTASIATPYTANPVVAAIGPIANLDSSADGSRRVYQLIPPGNPGNALAAVLPPPTSLSFSSVGAASMTLNWAESSPNIDVLKYVILRSADGGATYTFVNTVNVGTTTYNATGLTPSTAYSWRVYAVSEGGKSTNLDAVQVTNPPGLYTSVVTGNWNSASTWDAGSVPNSYDNAIVSAGTTVTVDAASLSINNLSVEGTLAYGTTPTNFTVGNNLTVASGGVVNVFNGTTGKTLTVAGNIQNNGTIDLSVGATTAGNLTLSGAALQTVSGSGSFNTGVIRNLTFSNTATATPNINWLINDVKVAYNLNLTGARINLGTNKMTFGAGAVGNTLTAPVGVGFLSGAKFSRWWAATGTGTAVSAGSDPTGPASRYPFINSAGDSRAMYITRTNATGATAGELAVIYNDASGVTSGLSVADGAYTINERYNGNWVVTNEGTAVSSSSYTVVLFAQNAFSGLLNGNARVMFANAVIGGTHQNGTTTPGAQRITVSQADLLSGPLYVGVTSSDIPFFSVANGNWNTPATWNKNAVPGAADTVTITNNTNVALAGTNTIAGLTVATGGTLTAATGALSFTSLTNSGTVNISGGSLTASATVTNNNIMSVAGGSLNVTGASTTGITNAAAATFTVGGGTINLSAAGANNRTFANNGIMTVTSGTVNVFGNMIHNGGSTFNQSGGNITIDGNDGGNTATSVAAATSLLNITATAVANLNLTGGTITIVDPHATSSSSYALRVSQGGAYNSAGANHTFKFGDGVSIDNGVASGNGFYMYLFQGSSLYGLGNVTVDAGTIGTNRFVRTSSTTPIKGNLNIISGDYQMGNGHHLAGNLINNGTLTAGSVLNMNDYNGAAVASTNPQTISGFGVFRNSTTTTTANLTSLTVNNSSATGLTLDVPLSISGTLTLTSGKVNTTNVNLLTLGTATAAGTLAGGSATAYVNGPLARTIISGNSNTTYQHFPVGKAAYAPIWLAPATTAVSNIKAEAFDSNTGTADVSLLNLSATRRWEIPLISGTINDMNVRLGDASIVSTSIPVQALAPAGVYTNAFGSLATYAAGTAGAPNTTQSNLPISAANFTGYISFADSNSCSGTPNPGNTVASSTSICAGASVALSLQNVVSGSGVTYQWKSSTDGTAYSDIAAANGPTLTVVPTVATYYQCVVTCSAGPATGTSTPVHVVFTHQVATNTPATRCGTGTVQLAATPSAGATINWYAAATGGIALGTGNAFTTPSISATTTYYAAAEVFTPPAVNTLGAGATTSSSTAQSFFPGSWGGTKTQYIIRASELNAAGFSGISNLTSLGFEPTASGQAYQGFTVQIGHTTAATAPTVTFINTGLTQVYLGTGANGGFTPVSNTLNTLAFGTGAGSASTFTWDGTSNIVVTISWSSVPSTTNATATAMKVDDVGFVSSAYRQRDSVTPAAMLAETDVNTTGSFRPKFIINGQSICSSARVPVAATVTTAPTFTLSGNPAAVCGGTPTAAVTITAGAADYDTYVWSPSTGVSGNAVTGWIFNTSAATTYTLTASNTASGCAVVATVNVTINSTPPAIAITPDLPTVCAGSIQPLTVSGAVYSVLSGAGTTTSGSSSTSATLGPNPLQAYYGGTKQQWIYTAAELTALGFVPNTAINGIKLELVTANTTYALTNLVVKMKNSATASFPSTTSWETGMTTVKAASSYTPVVGLNSFVLDAPFTWNGTDNLIIEMNYTNNNGGNTTTYNTAKHSPTTFVSTIFYRSDNVAVALMDAYAMTASYTYSARTDITFDLLHAITWTSTGTGDLFTDAAATVPYVAGSAAPKVYAKPLTSTTYTATATIGTCSSSDSNLVTVTPAVTPNFAEIGTICQTATAPTLATTSPNGITGTWSPATVNMTTSGSYVFTPAVGQCATTQTLSVVITPATTPNFAPIAAICQGSTAPTLATTSPNGVTGTWSPATISNTASGSYVFTPAVGQCATTQTLSVTVTVTPAPTGASPQDFPAGATLASFAVTGTGIIWYDSSTLGNVLPATTPLVSGTTYYASQTVGGCESVLRLPVQAGTMLNVGGFDNANFKYYPNPVNNILTVSYSEAITGLKLYNMVGQQLITKSVNANETQIDMSHLPAGSYLLEVSVGNKSKMVKLLKNQ